MILWSFGRAIVYLKRGAMALERIALAQEEQSRLAYQSYNQAHPSPRPIRRAEFGVASVTEDWNPRYERERSGLAVEDDDHG